MGPLCCCAAKGMGGGWRASTTRAGYPAVTLPRGVPSVDVGQRRYPPVDVALGESRTTGGRPAEFAPMRFQVESASAPPHTRQCETMRKSIWSHTLPPQ